MSEPPPIQYFQVVAAVIPTLAIAVALTARDFEWGPHHEGMLPSRLGRAMVVVYMVSSISVVLGATYGEVCALHALYVGEGTVNEARNAAVGVLCMGLPLTTRVIAGATVGLERALAPSRKYVRVLVWVWVAIVAYVFGSSALRTMF